MNISNGECINLPFLDAQLFKAFDKFRVTVPKKESRSFAIQVRDFSEQISAIENESDPLFKYKEML